MYGLEVGLDVIIGMIIGVCVVGGGVIVVGIGVLMEVYDEVVGL